MRKFEKYEEEVRRVGGCFAIDRCTNKIVYCNSIKCDNCLFNGYENLCHNLRMEWLYSEYTEQLTRRERMFCELMETGWIARDYDCGNLCWYAEKPEKSQSYWSNEGEADYAIIDGLNLQFNFIKWEDKEPRSVKDLLKLSVVNE